MSEQQRPYPHIFAQVIRATYRLEKVSSTAPLELVQETRLPLDYEDILSFIAFIGACRKVRGVAASKASGEWAFDYNPARHPLQHFMFTRKSRVITMASSSAYRLMDALLSYKEAHEKALGSDEEPKG